MKINKVEAKDLVYFDLFPLLKGLEAERPGIKDRVWTHMSDERDYAFKPWNGRISTINLYYYGIGDEYPTKYLKENPGELEHCKKIHPMAFIEDSKERELRLDLNLIWSVYDDQIQDSEAFAVKVSW